MKSFEVNFDGLVGPTHNYGGLAQGDMASLRNAFKISNPREAALQGLNKMFFLKKLGILQAVLPPHERPFLQFLDNIGFKTKKNLPLKKIYPLFPEIYRALYSSSGMWAANSATVSPSVDSQDGLVHITPANLVSNLHRSFESEFNYQIFNIIFNDKQYFKLHPPLYKHPSFADEGAANHLRFCQTYDKPGIQVFVYGKISQAHESLTRRYPARQTFEASYALTKLHRLKQKNMMLVKQSDNAIEQGVFHNDVISTGNQNVFLYHEAAFEETNKVITSLKRMIPFEMHFIPVSTQDLSIQGAVNSYIFNSQLVTLPNNTMALIAPLESQIHKASYQVLLKILKEDNPISSLHFVNCHQSMLNGGGPACLRLRVVLTEGEFNACHQGIFLDENLYQSLVKWIEKHFRDKLTEKDLLDPALIEESYTALDEVSQILKLGSIYSFQK